MIQTLADAALECCKRGWAVFPLVGKQPRIAWKSWQDRVPSEDQVRAWWAQWPDAGLGIVLGRVSGVVRLDADGDAASTRAYELGVANTPTFSTPNHGTGWLLAYEEGLETEVLWRGEAAHQELRLMSNGSYTVIPPSQHPNGGFYEWAIPPDALPAPVPNPLAALLRSLRASKLLVDLEKELKPSVEQPDRGLLLEALSNLPAQYASDYDTWVQVGMALHSAGVDLLPAWDTWSQGCPTKYKPGECERVWASFQSNGGLTGRSLIHWARQSGWNPPRELPQTDVGNARRFAKRHEDTMRHCHPWSKWLVWDGKRWAQDVAGTAINNAVLTAEALVQDALAAYAAAASANGDDASALSATARAKRMYAFAMASQNINRVMAALELAASFLPVAPSLFDQDPYILCCENGTVDLRTGTLREHRKEDWCTKLCPTELLPQSCPRFLQFLSEVFRNDATVSWLQKLFGYCLTGATTEHILPIFHGSGANGKSTLLSAVFAVLGEDYAGKAPKDLLLAQHHPTHPTLLASLFGKRLVAAVETGDGNRLDETTVKELTGNDRIACRRMYEDYWEFQPTHKIVLATNHRPEIRGTDHAVWRRIRLVPFTVVFDEASQDRDLLSKLTAEAPGILAWMLEGCLRWQSEGLGEAELVSAATRVYRSEQDRLTEFVEMHYERVEGGRAKIADVMAKYSLWCVQSKEVKLSGQAFGRAMQDRGFERDANKKYYLGLQEKKD
jgi:putative DNA primase/helicase